MEKATKDWRSYHSNTPQNRGLSQYKFYEIYGQQASYHKYLSGEMEAEDLAYRQALDEEERLMQSVSGSLSIGAPNDAFEQEADAVADQVAGTQSSQASLAPTEESPADIQAKGAASTPPVGFESKLNATKGSGEALPAAFKAKMETQTGRDYRECAYIRGQMPLLWRPILAPKRLPMVKISMAIKRV